MRHLSLYILSLISVTGASQTLPYQQLMRELPSYTIKERLLWHDPGTAAYIDTVSYSSASVGFTESGKDQAIYPQDGLGDKAIHITAQSYQHLDTTQTVWGDATFSNGKYKDIRWSDCIDYSLIAPYVLGDATGGDLNFRQYRFGGGYAYRLSDAVTLGAELRYRAEIAWRDKDPRVKTIVSDLNVGAGISYKLNANRIMGANFTIRSYSQNCDLDFFNPMNDINTLPLTGLGKYNKRFVGNTNKNSGHSGTGFSAGCHFASLDCMGIQMSADFDGIRIKQMLRDYNNLTLAYTDTYITTVSIGYGFEIGTTGKSFPTIEGRYFRRLGTENLFSPASGASYDKIGSYSPYLHEQTSASFEVPTELNVFSGYLSVKPSVGIYHLKESQSTAGRKIETEDIRYRLSLGYHTISNNKWLWGIDINYGRKILLSDRSQLQGLDLNEALQDDLYHTYEMLCADTNEIGASITIDRRIKNILAGASLTFTKSIYEGHGRDEYINASMHIKF